jgi:hypothetical protein
VKLTYRGNHYESEPTAIDMIDSQAVGRYRGQSITLQYPRHIPTQPVTELKYRGVAYATTSSGQTRPVLRSVQTKPAVPNSTVVQSVSAIATARQQALAEVARVHHQNILQSLHHRIEVARAKGDAMLVAQLEREMQQCA